VKSSLDNRVYLVAGESVKVIYDGVTALVVEKAGGERVPANTKDILINNKTD
jgi:hypothetical protein